MCYFFAYLEIILGIDPGYATCGFSLLRKEKTHIEVIDYGVITTYKNDNFSLRLKSLGGDIQHLLDTYSPSVLAMEKIFWGANVDNAVRVCEARGVIEFLCAQKDMKILEYSPTQVKSKLVGYGQAPKFQLQNILKMRLKLPSLPTPDDAADSLAIALIAAEELS